MEIPTRNVERSYFKLSHKTSSFGCETRFLHIKLFCETKKPSAVITFRSFQQCFTKSQHEHTFSYDRKLLHMNSRLSPIRPCGINIIWVRKYIWGRPHLRNTSIIALTARNNPKLRVMTQRSILQLFHEEHEVMRAGDTV